MDADLQSAEWRRFQPILANFALIFGSIFGAIFGAIFFGLLIKIY